MSFHRVSLYLFLAVQVIGAICSWLWQFVPSVIGVPLWGTALVLLVPGNFLGEWIVEKLLWHSSLSLLSMSILVTIVAFAINSAVWFAVVRVIGAVIANRKRLSSATK
jgi:fucose permease